MIPSSGEKITIKAPTSKIISPQPEYYHGWPTVATGRDGALHLIYSGGRSYHVCPFGRLDYMVSRDGGETWSWPRTIVDSLTDDRDSGILETKNGVLLASFFTSVAYQSDMNEPERLLKKVFGDGWPAENERWKSAELASTQVERKADVGLLAHALDGRGADVVGPLQGSRLLPAWSGEYDGRPRFYAAADGKKARAWISSDDGLTWKHMADLPTRAGELHSIEASDGTLIVHVRDKVQTPKAWCKDPADGVEGRRQDLVAGPLRDGRLSLPSGAAERRYAAVDVWFESRAVRHPRQDQPRQWPVVVGGVFPDAGCADLGSRLSGHRPASGWQPRHHLVRSAQRLSPSPTSPGQMASAGIRKKPLYEFPFALPVLLSPDWLRGHAYARTPRADPGQMGLFRPGRRAGRSGSGGRLDPGRSHRLADHAG